MTTLRKYKKLPMHIVEDHNDVLYHILRAVGSKHLPSHTTSSSILTPTQTSLLPPELKASEVFDVPLMLDKLSIENWLLVAAYAGQISTIVWVKPPWSNQIEDGSYKFLIGRRKGTDDIRVSSSLLYFVGEMLYCKASELDDAKELSLTVITMDNKSPDTLVEGIMHLIKEHNNLFVLDVDLDFFTTMNPFICMHGQVNMYSRLRTAYGFEYKECKDEESLNILLQNRRTQITTLKSIFTRIQELRDPEIILKEVDGICENIIVKEERENVIDLIKDLASVYGNKVDWGLVHDAGCTWDDEKHQLPHHVSSSDEIDGLVKSFSQLISALPPPTLVTIARSSLDDYCPPDQVDGVQESVCGFLRKTYDVDCKRHYEEEKD